MIKKWSYVAAAMLTVASGLALTSCIDNDEPYGIEQIRLATASLLEAKKAALEADKAAEQARIELDKLRLEIDKANAEKDKLVAEAEIKIKEAEAKAKELQAQADAAKTQAEANKIQAEADYWTALADDTKAKTEIYVKDQQAQIDEYIAQAEIRVKKAEVEYQTALYTYEKTKADDATKASNALWTLVDLAFEDYLTAIKEFNDANKKYCKALNELKGINADLVWVEETTKVVDGEEVVVPGHFDSPSYQKGASIESLIAKTEREIATKQKVIDAYNTFLADVDKLNAGNVYDLVETYKKFRDDAKVLLEQAKIEANQIKVDQADVLNAPKEIRDSITDLKKQKNVIPADTITPIPAIAALNSNWANPIYLVPAKPVVEYTYEQVENYKKNPTTAAQDAYSKYKAEYEKYILNFTLAMLDDNDEAWTKARLNEMNRQKDNDKALNNAVALWELARDVYNNGEQPKAELLPLAQELQKAIEDYNKSLNEVATAKTTVEDLNKAQLKAYKAYQEAVVDYNANEESVAGKWAAAQATYNETITKIYKELTDAQTEADNNYTLAIDKANLEKDKLWVDYQKAANEQAKVDNDPKSTQAQKDAAALETNTAYDAYDLYAFGKTVYKDDGTVDEAKSKPAGINTAYANARNAKNAAYDTALYNYKKKYYAAQEAQNEAKKLYLNDGGALLQENDKKYEPVATADEIYQKALKDWQDAKDAVTKLGTTKLQRAWDKMNTLADEQLKEIQKKYKNPTFSWGYAGAIPDWTSDVEFWYNYGTDDELPTAVAPVMLLNADLTPQISSWEGQVYVNARNMVQDASHEAYGILGYNVFNDNSTSNKYDSPYDWDQDLAFLLDKVDLKVLDEYIKKLIMKNDNKAEEDITMFDYYKYYNKVDLGLYGKQAKLLLDIKFAEDCLSDANSYLSSAVTKLRANLKNLTNTFEGVETKIEQLEASEIVASKEKDKLEAKANDAVKQAQAIWDVYNDILEKGYTVEADNVPDGTTSGTSEDSTEDSTAGTTEGTKTVSGLMAWLDDESAKISYYNPKTGKVVKVTSYDNIEEVKAIYQSVIDKQAEALAEAEEALAYYQYQLEQYKAGYPVKPVQEYEVERLKAEVEKCQKKVDFTKAHYEELQAQYDALNK